jgi:hypothetical protein
MKMEDHWRVIVVGGHTRSIGKTQLVCDLIQALPEANWVAGKITQYGHGVCAQNRENCDCAPEEHVCAISWESRNDSGTDSARFLAAGALRSFWLRTKQGFLAEGLPLLRGALQQAESTSSSPFRNLILESNTLLQFVKPALYLMVLDPNKQDFKDSARQQMDRASVFVLRHSVGTPDGSSTKWFAGLSGLIRTRPHFLQPEGSPVPADLSRLVASALSL